MAFTRCCYSGCYSMLSTSFSCLHLTVSGGMCTLPWYEGTAMLSNQQQTASYSNQNDARLPRTEKVSNLPFASVTSTSGASIFTWVWYSKSGPFAKSFQNLWDVTRSTVTCIFAPLEYCVTTLFQPLERLFYRCELRHRQQIVQLSGLCNHNQHFTSVKR